MPRIKDSKNHSFIHSLVHFITSFSMNWNSHFTILQENVQGVSLLQSSMFMCFSWLSTLSILLKLVVFFLSSNPSVDWAVVINVFFLLFPHNVIMESEVFQQFITTNFFILMTDILFIEIGQQMLFYDGFKIKLKKISELCVVFLLNWRINVVLI